jgi:hypothetical protein
MELPAGVNPIDVSDENRRCYVLKLNKSLYGCGARLGGAQSNVFNPSLGLFLYHILHTMSL